MAPAAGGAAVTPAGRRPGSIYLSPPGPSVILRRLGLAGLRWRVGPRRVRRLATSCPHPRAHGLLMDGAAWPGAEQPRGVSVKPARSMSGACALCSAPWRSLPAHATRHAQGTRKRGTSIRCSGANRQRRRRRPREHPPCHCLLEPLFSSLGLSSDIQTSAAAIFRTRRRRT